MLVSGGHVQTQRDRASSHFQEPLLDGLDRLTQAKQLLQDSDNPRCVLPQGGQGRGTGHVHQVLITSPPPGRRRPGWISWSVALPLGWSVLAVPFVSMVIVHNSGYEPTTTKFDRESFAAVSPTRFYHLDTYGHILTYHTLIKPLPANPSCPPVRVVFSCILLPPCGHEKNHPLARVRGNPLAGCPGSQRPSLSEKATSKLGTIGNVGSSITAVTGWTTTIGGGISAGVYHGNNSTGGWIPNAQSGSFCLQLGWIFAQQRSALP